MSETDDRRELSGLARSIDALFSSPARGRAAEPEAPAEPRDEVAEADEAVLEPLESPPQPIEAVTESVEPVAEPFDVTASSEAVAEPHDPVAEPIEAPPPPSPPPLPPPLPPETLLAVDQAVAAEPPEEALDPRAFEAAVEAFLAGAQGAAAEVQERAAALQERLVLDPLADAAERLVREAGDPPEPTLVDMAGAIIDPAVASRIVQRIGLERDEARLAQYTMVCKTLGEVMAKAFRGALTAATEGEARRKYHDILIAMSDTCRPIIEEMVEDENTLLVRSGVAILGEIGGVTAVPLVTSALANSDARVRGEALLSLGKLGDEESGVLVMGCLEDPDRDVRVAAATAAGDLKLERALRAILKQLEAEGNGDGAIPFIDALGRLGDPGAVPAIEKHAVKTLFSKPPVAVRIAAYRALHRIGTPHARDLVQKALAAKEPGVWAAVRQAVAAEGHE